MGDGGKVFSNVHYDVYFVTTLLQVTCVKFIFYYNITNVTNYRGKAKLRQKLVGIFVCMLLIATMAIPISALNKEYNATPEPNSADVPTWEVGDSWIYEVHHAQREAINLSMGYNLSCELEWTVVDDSGENYLLEGKAKSISAVGWVGTTGMVNSRFLTIKIEMRVGKTDLAIKSYNHTTKGYVFIKMGKLVIPIPIHAKLWRNTKFTPHRQILPFPLLDGKNGTFGSVFQENVWQTTMIWGFVELENDNGSHYTGEQDYTCNEEQITVPAGTYDTYNVTTTTPYCSITNHYTSEVGNTVSLYTKELTLGKWWLILDYKLISTTYTP